MEYIALGLATAALAFALVVHIKSSTTLKRAQRLSDSLGKTYGPGNDETSRE